ncbi:counting factor associated protein D [Pocillopora verrucosa]|uniref:counting factor associated protein D n=1 Tax=Pocillopora verrucosa TaxID=203993 RepID=UPI00333F23D8
MCNGHFIANAAVFWIIFTIVLFCNRNEGQHYFFEEINQLKSNFDPDQEETDKDLTGVLEPVITFENATLLQDDDQEENKSLLEKITFPEFYHAQGIISLPYDGIIEPFEAWYGGRHKMSRIDYYYGMDKTFQRGDLMPYGALVKLVPAHWKKGDDLDENTQSCWYRPGFRWSPEKGQNVVPKNLKKFKYVGEEIHSGMPVYKLQRTATVYKKNNTYTLYVTKEKPYRPVRYVMHGYDTLLHSFYDHYVVDYLSFHKWDFDFNIMKIPKGASCKKKIQKMKSRYHFNPMAEFMHENFEDGEVEQMFEEFKRTHKKSYDDPTEHEQRKHIFRHNMRFISSKNRAALNFTLAPNELSDVTDDEFEMYKGLLIDPGGGDDETLKKQEIPEARFNTPDTPLPKCLDWREYGAVTPAKAQGLCGSCWTFSSTGPIEGAYAIQTGKLMDVSEQQLMDCSWGFGNSGCRGGYSWKALVWAKRHGVASSSSYGRYLAQEGFCHCAKEDGCDVVKFKRVVTVKKKDAEALKHGLAKFGPASIAISASRKTLKFYNSGIYDDEDCSTQTNHGVVVVGYGEENGTPYWIVKNSWGKFWGEEGFVKIAMKDNLCGVLTNEPIFVTMNETLDDAGESYPFMRMKKQSFVDVEKKLNVTALKLSPFDYKRSRTRFEELAKEPDKRTFS